MNILIIDDNFSDYNIKTLYDKIIFKSKPQEKIQINYPVEIYFPTYMGDINDYITYVEFLKLYTYKNNNFLFTGNKLNISSQPHNMEIIPNDFLENLILSLEFTFSNCKFVSVDLLKKITNFKVINCSFIDLEIDETFHNSSIEIINCKGNLSIVGLPRHLISLSISDCNFKLINLASTPFNLTNIFVSNVQAEKSSLYLMFAFYRRVYDFKFENINLIGRIDIFDYYPDEESSLQGVNCSNLIINYGKTEETYSKIQLSNVKSFFGGTFTGREILNNVQNYNNE